MEISVMSVSFLILCTILTLQLRVCFFFFLSDWHWVIVTLASWLWTDLSSLLFRDFFIWASMLIHSVPFTWTRVLFFCEETQGDSAPWLVSVVLNSPLQVEL